MSGLGWQDYLQLTWNYEGFISIHVHVHGTNWGGLILADIIRLRVSSLAVRIGPSSYI